ncbi:MAG: MgtC/SapB family protein [Williamsia sp.]|nr:MgtC/SapB family protein [Williamsia sp.]
MDWNTEFTMMSRTLLACVLGAAIGIEREFRGKNAGIRTYAAVAVGACTFGLIGQHIAPTVDTRVAANVVVGIGFLGAGMIMKDGNRVEGLTTAATVWATAAVGLALSSGMYLLGVLTSVLIFFILALQDLPFWKKLKDKLQKRKRDGIEQ